MAEVALVADIDSVDENRNKVLLMTLHSAKGLEFPHVYLAGMEDGLFPSYMSIMADSKEEIAEERRLAYVGITRAKEDLTVTAAKTRKIRGETQYNPVSRFLQEIPQELLDNRVPKKKTFDFDEFPDETFSSAKKSFAKKPYQSVFGKTAPMEVYSKPRPVLSDNVFDKPKPVSDGNVFDQAKPVSKPVSKPATGGYQTITKPKPKAILKPKETRAEVKPFIAQGVSKGVAAPGTKPDYDIGDRVKHIKFGEGVVKAMEKGPRDYQVTVEFENYGQKILFAAFAKLQKI